MVRGRGKAIGPDLSNVGREMTLTDIQEVLRNPNGRITPGYDLVDVTLTDGKRLRGFARGRTNFDLQLQGLDGEFRFLAQSEIAALREGKQSLMKPLAATDEKRDLLA